MTGESARLAKPYTFQIISLDPDGQKDADDLENKGNFKQKQYNRTHLSEMYDLYDDIHKIRKADSHMIMIGNGKLIKHTGSIDQPEI